MIANIASRSFLVTAISASRIIGQAPAFLHDCTEVSYATLQEYLATGQPAQIGTDGLYAALSPEESDCLFVPLGPSSNFANEYPELYSSVVTITINSGAFGSTFLPGTSDSPGNRAVSRLAKRQRGCGALCTNSSCDSCKCKWDHSYCGYDRFRTQQINSCAMHAPHAHSIC
jgi:hypothetical protein